MAECSVFSSFVREVSSIKLRPFGVEIMRAMCRTVEIASQVKTTSYSKLIDGVKAVEKRVLFGVLWSIDFVFIFHLFH